MAARWLKTALRWTFFGAFLSACTLILVESAIDGDGSSEQSNAIAGQVQDIFDKNYDKNQVKNLDDFNVVFDRDPSANTFHTGDVIYYSCVFSPKDASDQSLKWEVSSTKEVLSVDEANCQINVVSFGNAEVKVSSVANSSLYKTYSFCSEKIGVTRISASEKEITLVAGDPSAYKIEMSVLPEKADDKTLLFSSSAPSVVEVDQNEGTLKPLAEGEATISISSVDNPSAKDSVHVIVSSSSSIQLEVKSISLSQKSAVLNKNVPVATIGGNYENPGAEFDPNKVQIDLGSLSSYLSVSEIKKTKPGHFSFKLALNNASVAEQAGFADLLSDISLSYSDLPDLRLPLSVAINHLKSVALELIDLSKVPSEVDLHYIHLTNMGYDYIEPLSFSVPFKADFRQSDFNQEGCCFKINESALISSKNNFSALSAAPSSEVANLSGKITYLIYGVEAFSFDYAYQTLEDSTSTIVDFGLSRFSPSEATELLANHSYSDSDLKGLFDTYVSVQSENSVVTKALKAAPLTFSCGDSSLAISGSNSLSSLAVLKEGDTNLTVTCKANGASKNYPIKGIASPNRVTLQLDGEDFSGASFSLDKGESKTFTSEAYVDTKLNNGESISLSLPCTIEGLIPETFKDCVSSQSDADQQFFAVKGIKQNSESSPISLSINVSCNGATAKSFSLEASVNYIPVSASSFGISASVLSEASEYSSANPDCSIVPLGTTLNFKAIMNEDATNPRVSYFCEQNKVLKVNEATGVAEAVGVGTATVKVVSQDDLSISASKTIKVIDSVSPFEFDLTKMNVPSATKNGDGSYSLILHYGSPYRFYVKTVASCSSKVLASRYADESANHVVRVDSSGLITTLGVGEETIEVAYENELQSFSVKVHVSVTRNFSFTMEELSTIVRKSLGHFLLFALTAALSLGFIFLTFKKTAHKYIAFGVSGIVGFLVAALSEFIQLFTPGRIGAWSDVGIDTAGYMTAILAAALSLGIVLLVRYIRKKKSEGKVGAGEKNAK